jgi:hypothetical protein
LNRKREKALSSILDDYMNAPIEDKKLDKLYSDIQKKVEIQSFTKTIQPEQKPVKKKILGKVGLVAVCIVGFFILIIAVPSIPQVQAFRFDVNKYFTQMFNPQDEIDQNGNITKHYSNIDQMGKDFDINLPKFNWVPTGFKLNDIKAQEDSNQNLLNVNLSYKKDNSSDDFIDIGMLYFRNYNANSSFQSDSKFDQYTVNNVQIAVSKTSPYNAHFYYHDSFLISISTSADKDDLLKIISNIE